MTTTTTTETLALLGGEPVAPEPLVPEAWPPVDTQTADRLREVYLSRQWSFDSPAEQAFASAYAAYHGAKHGVFTVNGTVTLELALRALGVGPGDEVIVPGLTWMATAMAVHYVGATPVFVDIEPTTLCLDPNRVADALTARTRAIIPVHLFGGMADIEALLEIASRRGLVVVEDCAHMQGGKWADRGVGSWGHVGSFSFQQSKTVASGEGGICLTNDDQLAEAIFRLKHIGYAAGSQQGAANTGPPEGLVCRNYRGTAFEATILHGQLEGLAERIAKYNQARDRIERQIDGIDGIRLQSRGRLASPQGYYALCAIFDSPPLDTVPRERIVEALVAEGLRVGGGYGPVYRHMLYNMPPSSYRIAGDGCPVAETAGTDRLVTIGHAYLGADDSTIDAIGRILAKVALNAKVLSAG